MSNSKFFLRLARLFGIDSISTSLDPLKAFLSSETKSSTPDKDGFVIDKYLAAAAKESESGNPDGLLVGERGKRHIIGSLIDLFVGGAFSLKALF